MKTIIYKSLYSSRRDNLPQANIIADKVICLPIYPELEFENVELICDLICKIDKL